MSAYLKLEGVKGDATAAGYAGWIDVLSVQFGNGPALTTATGASPGRLAQPAETTLHLTARVGAHSPVLFQAATNGKELNGELALTSAAGRYATVKLQRALVTDFQTSSSHGSGEAMDTFTLQTATPFKYEQAPQAVLVGRWLVTIGKWTGYFVFEAGGTVYWTERNGTARHNGKWKVTAADVQWKFATPGDIRTFVIPVPVPPEPIGGRILPVGQGFFTMQRG